MTAEATYAGISLVIGAVAGLITVVGGQIMAILSYVRAGKAVRIAQETHDSVNGQTEAFKKAIAVAANLEGQRAGVQEERDRHV